MSEPIVFKLSITKPFSIATCEAVRKGDWLLYRPASQDARAIPESDTLVECPEIMLVTAGSFDMTLPGLGQITLNAGEMGHPQRVKGAIRITAAEDGSGYICLTPRHGKVWSRMGGFLGAGESDAIEVPENEEAYFYVATGGLQGAEAGTLIPLPTPTVNIAAEKATRYILVWR